MDVAAAKEAAEVEMPEEAGASEAAKRQAVLRRCRHVQTRSLYSVSSLDLCHSDCHDWHYLQLGAYLSQGSQSGRVTPRVLQARARRVLRACAGELRFRTRFAGLQC